jgi:hypothetical protein
MRLGARREVSRAGSWRERAAAPAGFVALGLAACVEPDTEPYLDDSTRPIPGVVELGIDRDGQVQLEPGQGIAVGVQYGEGGTWQVTTACDTTLSGLRCDYDIVVSTDGDATIDGLESQGLESADAVRAPDSFALAAALDTGDDIDGFSFTTLPGATVRVSALLYDPGFDSGFEWSDDPRFINWVGNGAVHRGAPTNPVDLRPDRP